MARTPAISLRLKYLINWPSNVRHPFLDQYLRHVFQNTLMATPGIRSTPDRIYVNLTLLKTDETARHPLLCNGGAEIDFKQAMLKGVRGRMERRVCHLARSRFGMDSNSGPLLMRHKTMIDARLESGNPQTVLDIYRDHGITLRANMISNPLLNAEIAAQYVARNLRDRVSIATVWKNLLKQMGK
ncbi:hypothetical protein CXG81DRAFT_24710 [Caulochytrium protostelioides]|uniref:Uncharacterized protein n=1 Tax=Caulochytrium protostelioides TaxID=1555241 RepID=A0A4P9XBB4_9FUNG|nr:hypothetical protein CXG81DRAFT_24710 [Caulochytrium protostelioides]|eukprot:RKP02655.1 hypothetical protein CXG81DRAFT_24710 [Caulochytrium protostelioides]